MSDPIIRHEPPPGAVCAALGGCIGTGLCDYCGEPIRVARERMAALIGELTREAAR